MGVPVDTRSKHHGNATAGFQIAEYAFKLIDTLGIDNYIDSKVLAVATRPEIYILIQKVRSMQADDFYNFSAVIIHILPHNLDGISTGELNARSFLLFSFLNHIRIRQTGSGKTGAGSPSNV